MAEHFRNLLVCQDEKTISLLEVGANIKERYITQASTTNVAELIKFIDIINGVDTKYKASKNQRLLVEVMLMQLCSSGVNNEEKKNSIINIPLQKSSEHVVAPTINVTESPKTEYKIPIEEPSIANEVKIDVSKDYDNQLVKEKKAEQPKPTKRTVSDPKIDALASKIESKRNELNEVLELVGVAEAKRLDRAIKNVYRRIKELRDKIKNGDFSRRKPKLIVYNKKLIEAKRILNLEKIKFDILFEKQEFKELGTGSKILEYFYRASGTSKGFRATFDFSAMLRQGIILGSANPIEFKDATIDMHKFAFSNKKYRSWMTVVESSSDYIYMLEDGLSITDTSGDVLRSEERFVGSVISSIPVIGKITDASERAYGGFLNSLRVSVYRKLVLKHEAMGFTRQSHPKLFKNIAKFVNNSTGRGQLEVTKWVAKLLNFFLFSPRTITGMIGVARDMARKDSTPYLRLQAAKSLATFVGYQFAMKLLIITAYQLLVMPFTGEDEDDITQDFNPVSTDFNKLKIGNTRYDLSAGYGIAIRTLSRFYLNQKSKGIDYETGYGLINCYEAVKEVIRRKNLRQK